MSLTDAEREELQEFLAHGTAAPRARQRARAVLASGVGTRARGSDPAARTASTWLQRYRDLGLAGLEDAPRRGRPSGFDDDARARLLVAPLLEGIPAWSSRTVAEAAGTSQSTVVRTWSAVFVEGRASLPSEVPQYGLNITGFWASPLGSVIALTAEGDVTSRQHRQDDATFMRSVPRKHLQILLATQFAVDAVEGDRTADSAGDFPNDLPELVAAARAHRSWFFLCSSEPVADRMGLAVPAATIAVVGEGFWQGLLLELGTRLTHKAEGHLGLAQRRAMEWARSPTATFLWTLEHAEAASRDRIRVDAVAGAPPATSDAVSAAIASWLHVELLAGRLQGGDHIPESRLARTLHTSRGHVREALRVLASQGVIDLQPHKGAVVPVPDLDDVLETYAARRVLGALIVRRTTESPRPQQLARMRRAHSRMLMIARSDDAWSTGDADLDFQDVMASASDMRRVARMFVGLTVQLRLYVAVLGVRYAYPVPDMCDDNSRLMERVSEGDVGAALVAWDAKMRDAASYMVGQLRPAPPRR